MASKVRCPGAPKCGRGGRCYHFVLHVCPEWLNGPRCNVSGSRYYGRDIGECRPVKERSKKHGK